MCAFFILYDSIISFIGNTGAKKMENECTWYKISFDDGLEDGVSHIVPNYHCVCLQQYQQMRWLRGKNYHIMH